MAASTSKKILRQPRFWLLAVFCLILFFLVIVLFVSMKTAPRAEREAPIPVPSIAPFVEQTITEPEMIALEKEALSPAGVDTSDWPTYTNKKYGFLFKYPEGVLIEGDTGFEKTHPEYASYLSVLAHFEYQGRKYARFYLSLRTERLTPEGDKCIPGPKLPLTQYVEKLREANLANNEEHKAWKPDASVSEVIPVTSGKEEGYKLIFKELLWDKCVSAGIDVGNKSSSTVYRIYEDKGVRIKAENTFEKDQPENPLYQVILDTLEITGLEQ